MSNRDFIEAGMDGQELVSRLERRLRFDETAIYKVERAGSRNRVTVGLTKGFEDDVWPRFSAFVESAPTGWATYDPARPEPAQRNRALLLRELPVRPKAKHTHRTFFGRHDQLRALICDGPVLLAWVGGLRETPFTTKERRQLQELVEPTKAWLVADHWKRLAQSLALSLDAALDALGAQAMLVDAHGRVVHASATLAAQGDPQRLVACAEQARDEWMSSDIGSPGMPRLRLLIRRQLPTSSVERITRFARRVELTPRQTEVLQRVGVGEPNKQIAARLGCAEGTVEAHLSAIYRRAHVGSRTELLALIWASPSM